MLSITNHKRFLVCPSFFEQTLAKSSSSSYAPGFESSKSISHPKARPDPEHSVRSLKKGIKRDQVGQWHKYVLVQVPASFS